MTIMAKYNTINTTKSGGKTHSIKVVSDTGMCCLCPADYALTQHHIFGKDQRITMRLCRNCHHMVHAEVESGQVGPFGRRVFEILAGVFPVRAPVHRELRPPEFVDPDLIDEREAVTA